MSQQATPGMDLLQIEDELTDEERLFRDTVRAFAATGCCRTWRLFRRARCPARSCRSRRAGAAWT